MRREFTATAYLFYEGKTLLLKHPKHHMWLPPGGHIEPNEMPHEAAEREVKEECGLDIEFILQENIAIHETNAKSIPRPYLCLQESISNPIHEHIDLIFLAQAFDIKRFNSPFESVWLSLEDLEPFFAQNPLFEDTKHLLRHLQPHLKSLTISNSHKHSPV